MSDILGVFSGKGGVGKTTIVANLGASLTNIFRKNVIIFDTNLATSHLGMHLGIYEDLPVTLREVLQNKAPILHAVYTHPQTGIRIIPAPLSGDGVSLTKSKLCTMCSQIKNDYDIVIIDTSPGLGKEFVTAAQAVDAALVVTTPEITAVTDAMKTIEILRKLKRKILGIIVNRVQNKKYELTPKEIESTTGEDVISVVHEDGRVAESISKGVPVILSYPNSRVANDINQIAGLLIGQEYVNHGWLDGIVKIFDIFRPKTQRIEIARPRIPKPEKETIEKEVEDTEKLRKELSSQLKDEIKKEIKEKVKKKLMERVENG